MVAARPAACQRKQQQKAFLAAAFLILTLRPKEFILGAHLAQIAIKETCLKEDNSVVFIALSL